MLRTTLVICLALLGAACAAEASKEEEKVHLDVTCPEVRPELCTMEYDPVEGWLKSGEWREYPNGCSACSDPEVVGYRKLRDAQQLAPAS